MTAGQFMSAGQLVRRRSHNNDEPSERLVVNGKAERAPPLVPVVEVVRPVGRPSVNFQTLRSAGKQNVVDPIEIPVGIGSPVRRAKKRLAIIEPVIRTRRRKKRRAF